MRVLALLATWILGGCIVMRPPRVDERPVWRISGSDSLDADCASARALVRKSGKQGIGMSVQLKSRADCAIKFTAAHLAFTDGTKLAVTPPTAQQLPGRSLIYVWWPVAFDNNAAWNAGRRSGVLTLDYAIGSATGAWQVAMEQR